MASNWFHDEFARTLGECGLEVCPICNAQGRVSQPIKTWFGWKLAVRRCPGCDGIGTRRVYVHGK